VQARCARVCRLSGAMVNIDACRGWSERVEEGERPKLNGGELSVPRGAERIRSPTHTVVHAKVC
jgi:hypothetical protein